MLRKFVGVILLVWLSEPAVASNCANLFVPAQVLRDIAFLPSRGHDLKISPLTLNLVSGFEQDGTAYFKEKVYGDPAITEHTQDAKTILYPASGSDIVSAFKMFPSAELVIGLDNHPMVTNPAAFIRGDWDLTAGGTWAHVSELDQDRQSLADRMLAHLRTFERTARVYKIYALTKDNISHGWLEFDLGEGTPRRRYLHIHTFTSDVTRPPLGGQRAALFFEKLLEVHNPGAIMFKAAMGLSAKFLTNDPPSGFDDQAAQYPLALNHLIKNKGLIVDGDSLMSSRALKSEIEEGLKLKIEGRLPWGYSVPTLYKF